MTVILRPAEYVLPGHPDKLCDAIADALVEEAARRERRALAAIEVAAHRGRVYITGRLACEGAETIDVAGLAQDIYRSAGYDEDWYPAPERLEVVNDLCLEPLLPGEAEARAITDDQGFVHGYANAQAGTNHLPTEHWLAWRLAGRLGALRRERPDLSLGPDGKVLVILAEDTEGPSALDTFSCSLQQADTGDDIALVRAVRTILGEELQQAARLVPGLAADLPARIEVNGAGSFSLGGPEGDNGLSGKKLVVDAYGPRVPIGGGALSGKDFFTADRAGALLARRIAKAVVLTGAAREARATLAWAPGDAELRLLALEADGGRYLDVAPWAALFDRRLEALGEAWTGAADLVGCARRGHFTRAEVVPWESIRVGA